MSCRRCAPPRGGRETRAAKLRGCVQSSTPHTAGAAQVALRRSSRRCERAREVEATLDPLQQRLASEAESARTEAALARESLSEARSAVAKWEQECALQGTSKDNLLDEVNALKAEAKDLTEAHAREVERLQERLGQLEGVHDTLDVALAEGEQKFEAELAGKRDEFEAKVRQQEEQAASLTQQHEEVRGGLVEVRQALSLEQKERQVAEEAMRDARETAEQKVADAEERERRLQESLDDIQSERKRIEGESADERRDAEEKLKKLTDDHGEVTRKQKEAQERAAEFERQWIAESKLRKELHNTLQEIVGNLRVYCRIRPPVMGEESHVFANGQTGLLCTDVRGQDVVVVRDHDAERPVKKKFEFTQVYGPASSQEDVFRDTEPLMTSVLDGFNVCIFAYGQSGSGKTFTLEGTEEKQGLVPRAMARVFGNRRTHGKLHPECFLSMFEIYNEQVHDLLWRRTSIVKEEVRDYARRARRHVREGPDLRARPHCVAQEDSAQARQAHAFGRRDEPQRAVEPLAHARDTYRAHDRLAHQRPLRRKAFARGPRGPRAPSPNRRPPALRSRKPRPSTSRSRRSELSSRPSQTKRSMCRTVIRSSPTCCRTLSAAIRRRLRLPTAGRLSTTTPRL